MTISRVPGFSLLPDLDRQGIDLDFTTGGNSLVHMDFANFRLGINETSPTEALHVVGNILVTDSMLGLGNVSQNLGSESVRWNNIWAANAIVSAIQAGTIYGTLTNPTQPNITSVGNLATLTVTGELFAGNITTANIAGNIATGYQPYINELDSVTIHDLTTTGNISFGGNTVSDVVIANVIYEAGYRVLTANSNIVVFGDVTGYGNNSNIVVTLVNTGVIAGIYGSGDDEYADRVPKITVDSKGRITNIANVLLTQVGNVTFNDTTISTLGDITVSTPGNINLDAQGTGIVQIVGSDALGLPYGNNATRPAAPDLGYVRYNTDVGDIEWWTGNLWKTTLSGVTSEVITPDGVSNSFVMTQSLMSAEGALVTINGTIQQPTAAYSVTGNVITFAEVPLTTDVIEVRTLAQSLSTITATAVTLDNGLAQVQLNASNIEVTGNLLPSANLVYSLGSNSYRWKDLYVGANTIYIGDTSISASGSNLLVGGSPITIGGNITATTANIAGDLRATQIGLGKDPQETLDIYGVADASIQVTSAVNNNYVYYGCDFGTMQINGDYSGLEMNSYTYPPFIQLLGPGNVTIGHPNINLRTTNTAPESYTYISGGREATIGAHVRFINENANVFATSRSALAFYTSNSSAYLTEQLRITSNGDIGIGTSTPGAKLHVYDADFVTLLNESDTNTALQLRAYNTSNSPEIDFVRTRGTKASPTAVGTGDELYHIYGYGYGGSGYSRLTDIMSGVSTYVSDTNISSYLAFSTCNQSNNVTERMRITSAGTVGIGTNSPLANLHVAGNVLVGTTLTVTGNLTSQSDITGYSKFTFSATQGNIIGKESQSIRFPSQGVDIVTVSGTNVNINTGNTGTLAVAGSINTTGRLYVGGLTDVETILERANISAAAATGTVNADILDNAVMLFTSNATANWTYNVRGNATTRFDTVVSTGQSVSLAFLATIGATSYIQSNFTIDSSNVTVRWQGNAPPSTSTLNSIQLYTFTIIKRAANTYTALGSVISYV